MSQRPTRCISSTLSSTTSYRQLRKGKSVAFLPIATATLLSISSRSAGAKTDCRTFFTNSATRLVPVSEGLSSGPSGSSQRTSTPSSRRWLRQKYLPQLVATGEPSDFGRPFRTQGGNSQETSPIASPSGDLVAAFSTVKGDLDLVLFDAENRRMLRNLTKGSESQYQNLIAQHLTIGSRMGRDIAFSPDGNYLAAFASKREAGRALVIVNVVKGGIERVIDMEVEQQQSPAWSPDGKKIVFSGNTEGVFDLFLLDVETLEIQNVTNDPIFDGGPSFSPDGSTLVFSSVIGEPCSAFRPQSRIG